jgi:hypothetical protein
MTRTKFWEVKSHTARQTPAGRKTTFLWMDPNPSKKRFNKTLIQALSPEISHKESSILIHQTS